MIRNAASERQVQAADPAASTWLSANAGSGKTRVLTDRVARLLLDGVDPLHILCLTYTKAAASEMQNRLFDRLGRWAMLDDAALTSELHALGLDGPVPVQQLNTARTLFARAIETPGGLRIQTIHSFCASLLRRFPLEAGVSPQFREMEEQAAKDLRLGVLDTLSVAHPEIVSDFARFAPEERLDDVLLAILKSADHFRTPATDAELRTALDLPLDLTEEALLEQTFTASDSDTITATITLGKAGSSNEQKDAAKLSSVPRLPSLIALTALEKILLTQSGKTPFAAKTTGVLIKATRAAHPDVSEALNDLMERVEAARPMRLGLAVLDKSTSLHRFAAAFIAEYEQQKLAAALLDFDDLINKARGLLRDPAVAQWVLFRLDGGIDHILVDEAQDTSPLQWDVIRSLAQEFSAGEGAQPDRSRTIFVVGDKKQSIYSFQGADPEGFDQMRDHFGQELAQVNEDLVRLELEYSFRSSAAILTAVDLVFNGPHRGQTGWDSTPHRAFKDTLPGRVDLWPPLEETSDKNEDFDWTAPVDQVSSLDTNVQLAGKIADEIARMIASETLPQGDGHRPITPGDFLILVQRRSTLFAELIRSCKARGLDVAGSDRLKVGAELAVKDIISVLSFLALAEDDLSLATALKSPFFGWDEQALYTLAHHRPEGSFLWTALRNAADAHPATMDILNDLRDQSDFLRPYDLINRLLTRHDGRRKLLSRLGREAEDGIDALLSQALAYERSDVPSLTGFLEWIKTDEMEIKRQIDSASDQIRVMSVHGSKGLEAPIVILPDTAKRDIKINDPLYHLDDLPIWAPASADRTPAIADVHAAKVQAQQRERDRLLYVAMTRAENWLIVCAAGKMGDAQNSWHAMVSDGLDHAGTIDLITPTGAGKRLSHGDWTQGALLHPQANATDDGAVLHTYPIVAPPDVQQSVRNPSDLGGAKALAGEITHDLTEEEARARGSLIHLLLEHLPEAPAGERADLAQSIINGFPSHERFTDVEDIVSDVLALIDAPHLADIFAPDALREVDLTAEVPGLGRMHGIIDRLLIRDNQILAVDYKTNRVVPDSVENTPEGVLRQLAAYDIMLRQIWPGKDVSVAILWTATQQLMPLPQPLLDTALNGVK